MNNKTSLTLCIAIAACGPLDAEEATTDETTSALTGVLSVTGTCDPSNPNAPQDVDVLYQSIVDAKALAESLVFTDWFRTCVEQSIPIDDDGWTAEQIVLRSGSSKPIRVFCAELGPGTNGYANINIPDEAFQLDTDLVRDRPLEQIAGVMIHEILHTWGAVHPSGGGISFNVPRVPHRCIQFGRSEGVARDEIAGDVALPKIGGGLIISTSPTIESSGRCDADELATGVDVEADGNGLTSLSLRCSEERSGQLIGSRPVGGYPYGSGSAYTLSCPAGTILTGVQGTHTAARIAQLSVVCSALGDVRSDGADFSIPIGLVGTPAGLQFRRDCAPGKAVVGIRQRGSSRVNEATFVCDDVASPDAPRRSLLTAPNQPAYSSASQVSTCEGEQFLASLYGQTTGASSLRRIGGACATVSGDDVSTTWTSAGRPWMNRTDPVGGPADEDETVFRFPCASGEVVVGYRVWTDTRVRAAVPLCATPQQWRTSASVFNTPWMLGGTFSEARCPVGRAATGFMVKAAATVRRLHLWCSDLPVPAPRGRLVLQLPWMNPPPPWVGGSGGQAFAMSCPEGGPVSGLPVALAETNDLVGVSVACGYTDGSVVRDDGYVRPPVGGRAGTVDVRCPNGEVLVGMRGTEGGSPYVVRTLGMVCQSLADVRAGSTAARTRTSPRGNASLAYASFERTCPAGEVVTGLTGAVGGFVDRLQLRCGPPDLAVGTSVTGLGDGAYRRIPLPADRSQLRVRATAPLGTNYEILVKRGRLPTSTDNDARATTPFIFGWATVPAAEAGTYWVRVSRISGSGSVTLTVD